MGKRLKIGVNDLKTIAPEVAAEWDYEKNDGRIPENTSAYSNQMAWWLCSQGHSWEAKICNRANGRGCPVCANLSVVNGVNDLVTLQPELAKEWNYTRNHNLQPQNFVPGSNKKLWWVCQSGHEWEAKISDRNKGVNCPYCTGKKMIPGETDLLTTHPELCKEWDYKRNTDVYPNEITAGSGRLVWWKCSQGHEWQSTLYNRTGGKGCPYCVGKKVKPGDNDLATISPELACEWNHEKNGELLPTQVTAKSNKKVWWKCKSGHEWEVSVNSRNHIDGINACPYCSGSKTITGENDLVTTNPDLASEWDYEKNGSLIPNRIKDTSNKKVWWRCKKGHSWEAVIQSRKRGAGCPYCSGRYAIPNENDLTSVNPQMAKEWNYEKNGELTTKDVTAHSNKKVWWKCNNGHEWKTSVNHRTHGDRCPVCRLESNNGYKIIEKKSEEPNNKTVSNEETI